MAIIGSVNVDAGCGGGGMLDIVLSIAFNNGQTILLSLEPKADDPLFTALLEDGRLYKPKTDGRSVYWPDGPSLPYGEIMDMVGGAARSGRRRIAGVKAYDAEDPETVVVELDNGNVIMLELGLKMNDPLFAQIRGLSLPLTDGERVYWSNGASLTMDEIMTMLLDTGEGSEK